MKNIMKKIMKFEKFADLFGKKEEGPKTKPRHEHFADYYLTVDDVKYNEVNGVLRPIGILRDVKVKEEWRSEGPGIRVLKFYYNDPKKGTRLLIAKAYEWYNNYKIPCLFLHFYLYEEESPNVNDFEYFDSDSKRNKWIYDDLHPDINSELENQWIQPYGYKLLTGSGPLDKQCAWVYSKVQTHWQIYTESGTRRKMEIQYQRQAAAKI